MPAPSTLSSLWRTWYDAGRGALISGEYRRARELLDRARQELSADVHRSECGLTLAFLAYARMREGDLAGAQRDGAMALNCLPDDDEPVTIEARARLAHALARATQQSDLSTARRHVHAALEGYARLQVMQSDGELLRHVGTVAARVGQDLDAATALTQGVQLLPAVDTDNPSTLTHECYRASVLALLIRVQMRLSRFRTAETHVANWKAAAERIRRFCETYEPPDDDAHAPTRAAILAEVDTQALTVSELLRLVDDPDEARAVLPRFGMAHPSRSKQMTEQNVFLVCEELDLALQWGTLAEVLRWRALAETIASPPGATQARLLNARGRCAWIAGELDPAEDFFRRSAEIKHGTRRLRMEAATLGLRLRAVRRDVSGVVDAAKVLLQELQTDEPAVSLELGRVLHTLAAGEMYGMDPIVAGPPAKQALQALEATLGPKNSERSELLQTLAEWAWSAGDATIGVELAQQAAEAAPSGPWGGLTRARSAEVRGRCLLLREEWSDARIAFAEAQVEYRRLTAGTDRSHPETGLIALDLATWPARYGDVDLEVASEAEAALRPLFDGPQTIAYELIRRGNVHYEIKQFPIAAALYAWAARLYRAALGPGHAFTQQAEANLQRARRRQVRAG